MIKKISHIGVAVKSLDKAANIFSKLINIEHTKIEEVSDQRVRIAFISIGDVSLELTEATSPDSPIAKFIEKRGEGIHHISFEVDDIHAELARLKADGYQLIDERPRLGAGGHLIAFIHPKSSNGVLIELSQRTSCDEISKP